jgi:Uma2 family endonuclease
MATATAAQLPAPYPIHRFTVAQYHRMIEMGILTANDKVELLEGWIVPKMPRNPPHDATLARINRLLIRTLPDEWVLRVQSAITLRTSEPEPDFAVVRGPEDLYFQRHPAPRDVALLIEVASSTLLADRRNKGRLYAQARIPEYWIINLVAGTVEVYTDPRAGRTAAYRQQHNYELADAVPLRLQGRELARIPVRALLP